MTRIKLISGDEVDAFSNLRRILNWKPGQRRAAKRQYNRRFRRLARLETRAASTRDR